MTCLACGSGAVEEVLDLGATPLANALLDAPRDGEERVPLRVGVCADCALVQLLDVVDRAALFSDYPYFSSVSDTVVDNAAQAVRAVLDAWSGEGERLAVEVASNDGYLLKHYQRQGVPVLGIEPAANIAAVAEQDGVPTRCVFFGRQTARALAHEGVSADVIHANNVLAHVDDLPGFVAGLRTLLGPQGRAVIEVPYVGDLVEHVEFDTIYHEHLAYFSVTALDHLFQAQDLRLERIDRLPIHGGSLRVWAAPGAGPPGPTAQALLDQERAAGLDRPEGYRDFGRRVQALCTALRDQVQHLRTQGARVAAYGASAKGTTLLHAARLGREQLDYVVDRAPAKQGRYTPGTHLPIHAPEHLLHDAPDVVLLLTWNHADEILRQQAEFRARGGRFLVPVPEPRLV